MAAVVPLDSLLQQRRIWRGQAWPEVAAAAQPTGWATLDAALPGGGWPEAALVELLLPADGIGELRLLLPTLARLSRAGKALLWVDPPYRPYAPALAAAGVDLRQLWCVDGAGREAPWAIEQGLRSRACGAVLGWATQADDRLLRRWQLAAEAGQALAFLFRPLRAAQSPSPAALRLQCGRDEVRVLKCRGGLAPARPVHLCA
ncbi:MAG TPA: translesion DNA synthesis-associated protein ImuA [Arenimonas sp.]|nr:translesion DNA synthesis-associated protein ImuA [Arenimonas sp.]